MDSFPPDPLKQNNKFESKGDPGILAQPLAFLNDPEEDHVPDGLPFIVDGHVHLFPDHFFSSVWSWFDNFAWQIRYKLTSEEILDFLLCHGVDHIVALHYAHKPGVASELNAYMARLCKSNPAVTGTATVFPGEVHARSILEDAFQSGLKGVKLHCHVQCFDMNSPAMGEIYEVCTFHSKPLIMHVGREPKSPAYPCDPYQLCSAGKLEKVLKAYPDLNLCVPHLGWDELDEYHHLIEKYDNLWLDTTMILADYFPVDPIPDLSEMRPDRIIFGTDFPNLPYAWDREIKKLVSLKLSDDTIARILGRNACEFYGINLPVVPKKGGGYAETNH
ncbi:MAG: amidohydrolase [Deltaproteobacteria bacterium]|jgi:predicted TIM-barrel fold metal-dependent hydrolase|nr:amidohydrolase [Deltaproteobacteria bacterium]